MVSHLTQGGGDFLPPQRKDESTQLPEDAILEVMLHYKRTGCKLAKEALLIYYMENYVAKAARRIASGLPSCVDPDDLTQAAFFALNDYIDKFEPSLGYKFESCARLRIDGSMLDYLRKEDPASRLARSRSKMIALGINDFKTQNGRPPTDEELRVLLKLDAREFTAAMGDVHIPNTLSFHPSEDDDNPEATSAICVEVKNNDFTQVDRQDLHCWLYKQLEHYDLLIVTLTYTENLTMLEIGGVLGFSESRISQRLKQIHAMLKQRLLDHPDMKMLMAG